MEQTYQGMLDEFAGRAMQAIMRRNGTRGAGGDRRWIPSSARGWSYEQALAMMKERARRKAAGPKAPPPHG